MTKLEIWNKALALLPHDVEVDDEDEVSKEAKVCRDNWHDAVNAVAAAHEWGWCAVSVPLCGAPAYGVPRPDCVRLLGVFGCDGRRVRARIVDGLVFAGRGAAFMRYVPDVSGDVADWPGWFADAVVAELAYRMGGVMTGNQQQRNILKGIAAERLAAAARIDSSETAWNGTDGRTFARARS